MAIFVENGTAALVAAGGSPTQDHCRGPGAWAQVAVSAFVFVALIAPRHATVLRAASVWPMTLGWRARAQQVAIACRPKVANSKAATTTPWCVFISSFLPPAITGHIAAMRTPTREVTSGGGVTTCSSQPPTSIAEPRRPQLPERPHQMRRNEPPATVKHTRQAPIRTTSAPSRCTHGTKGRKRETTATPGHNLRPLRAPPTRQDIASPSDDGREHNSHRRRPKRWTTTTHRPDTFAGTIHVCTHSTMHPPLPWRTRRSPRSTDRVRLREPAPGDAGLCRERRQGGSTRDDGAYTTPLGLPKRP